MRLRKTWKKSPAARCALDVRLARRWLIASEPQRGLRRHGPGEVVRE
jgi:hypothetical protein